MNRATNVIIESLGVYLPPRSVSTRNVLNGCEEKIRFPLEKVTGIEARRMAGEKEFSIDLARRAIADCFSRSKYAPSEIDILICCNISRYDAPDSITFEPSTSIRLRKEAGFTNALVFDVANACAGMFTGIYILHTLLQTGAVRRGMVASGEYITHLTQNAQEEIESFMDERIACLTLGDAGAALILEKASGAEAGFQEVELRTYGRYSPYCVGKVSERNGMIMFTDSVNLTNAAIKSGARHSIQILERSGWPVDGFQHLIMHQTSRLSLNSARKEINRILGEEFCREENTVNNLRMRGNTASTSHFVAVADLIRENRIQPGDRVIFSISASGLTTGTALYVFDDLPDRFREGRKPRSIETEEPVGIPWGSGVRGGIYIEQVGTLRETPGERLDTLQMLEGAARDCLRRSAYQPDDIGLLIYCGVFRSEYILEPAIATLLAGALDMNASPRENEAGQTLAFDIFNGSLGYLNACWVASQMMEAKNIEACMIVASECENNARDHPDKLLGVRETASAILLHRGPSPGKGFTRFVFRYPGEALHTYTVRFRTFRHEKPYLEINKDPELEDIYISAIAPAVKDILQEEGLEPDAIDKVFPPQISSGFIAKLSQALDLPPEKFIDATAGGPDLYSSSLAFGAREALEGDLVKAGDKALVIAIGAGVQVGCALYQF